MKLIQVVAFVFLLLVSTIPEETEAIPITWFLHIARVLGIALLKNAYYARCNVPNVPFGISCPTVAYGMGWSRQSAQAAARLYAGFRDSRRAKYVKHCDIYRYKGKNRKLKGK